MFLHCSVDHGSWTNSTANQVHLLLSDIYDRPHANPWRGGGNFIYKGARLLFGQRAFQFQTEATFISLSFSVDWQMHLDTQLTRRVTWDSIVQTRVSVIPTYDKVERNSATELSFELH